jgi:hypothetical protein
MLKNRSSIWDEKDREEKGIPRPTPNDINGCRLAKGASKGKDNDSQYQGSDREPQIVIKGDLLTSLLSGITGCLACLIR